MRLLNVSNQYDATRYFCSIVIAGILFDIFTGIVRERFDALVSAAGGRDR